MIDLTLLRCMTTREDYEKYRPSVPLKALEARTAVLIRSMDKYYTQFPDEDQVDFITFRDLFKQWYRKLSESDLAYYDKILRRVEEGATPEAKAAIINSLIELSFATDVANLVSQYQSGDEVAPIQEVELLLNSVNERLARRESHEYDNPDLSTLFTDDEQGIGLTFRYDSINRSIRPLRDGDAIVVAGRPDKGKTSFIADAATHMAGQDPRGRPVLWCTNEGVRTEIIKRSYSATVGCTTPELIALQQEGVLGSRLADGLGGDLNNLQIVDIVGWTNAEVLDLCKRTGPCLVILDMIDKINFIGMGSQARTDQVLEEQYGWFREQGIMNGWASIFTSQISAAACDSNDSQMWPEDWMLKDSRTGKQGACDVILMIGHSKDPMCTDSRYISAPKNKLKPAGAPELRTVLDFQKDRCRYRG